MVLLHFFFRTDSFPDLVDLVANGLRQHLVVGDKKVGRLVLLLVFLKEMDDLGLGDHVQHAGGFVQNDEFRLQHQDPRQGGSLKLAAGKLQRCPVEMLPVKAKPLNIR